MNENYGIIRIQLKWLKYNQKSQHSLLGLLGLEMTEIDHNGPGSLGGRHSTLEEHRSSYL